MSHIFNQFLFGLIQTLADTAPYIIIGFFFAALVHEFVPVALLARHFSDKGIWPVVRATFTGILLPVCSCGVVPLGVGIFKGGAARGTTLSFMASTPALSPVSILLCLNLLGIKFTAIYLGMVLCGAFLIGLLANWLYGGAKEDAYRKIANQAICPLSQDDEVAVPWYRRIVRAMRWGFWDLGSEVSIDLFFGLSLAALVVAFLPMQWIATWLGKQYFITIIYVVVVSIFVYTCAMPSIPVVQNLLLRGMTPGAGIAFLIAGPATNPGELIAIARNMGKPIAIYFTLGVIAVGITAGWGADQLFYTGYHYHALQEGGKLVVTSACVPIIFSNITRTADLHHVFRGIPGWYLPFLGIMAVTICLGGFRHIYRVFINPCSFCHFWQDQLETAYCGGQCDLKRVHLWLTRGRRRRASASALAGTMATPPVEFAVKTEVSHE